MATCSRRQQFAGVSILLLVAAVVVALAWFAWWFLRAGKRYDERERAAGRRPPGH